MKNRVTIKDADENLALITSSGTILHEDYAVRRSARFTSETPSRFMAMSPTRYSAQQNSSSKSRRKTTLVSSRAINTRQNLRFLSAATHAHVWHGLQNQTTPLNQCLRPRQDLRLTWCACSSRRIKYCSPAASEMPGRPYSCRAMPSRGAAHIKAGLETWARLSAICASKFCKDRGIHKCM